MPKVAAVELTPSGIARVDSWLSDVALPGLPAGPVRSDLQDALTAQAEAGEPLAYTLPGDFTQSGAPALIELGDEDVTVIPEQLH